MSKSSFISKLPFKKMAEKSFAEKRANSPFLDKFLIPYANHLAFGVILLVLVILVVGFPNETMRLIDNIQNLFERITGVLDRTQEVLDRAQGVESQIQGVGDQLQNIVE